MDRMSVPTNGTSLLPAAGGMIHAMHGGGGDGVVQTTGTLLPAAGGMIHAMSGGSGSLLPAAGGTIHAMSGGDGGFVKTTAGASMIPEAKAQIHARSGGFQKGGKRISHLGESYLLMEPPKVRENATDSYPKDSDEYKILYSLGLEDLYKLDRDDIKGTKQEYDVLQSIYDGTCNLNSSLGSLVKCEPIRRVIHTLAQELKTSLAFSMNIFNEADRAALNAAKSLNIGAKEKLADAIQRPENEESNASKELTQAEKSAQAALDALQREEEHDPLSDEDHARIAIAATMAHSILSEMEREELAQRQQEEAKPEEAKPEEAKPEDPFQTASVATIAVVHDPSSLPVPVATAEEEKEADLTEEDEARIAMIAMMATDPALQMYRVKSYEPGHEKKLSLPIDPKTDPNGYIAQLKIQEALANIEIVKAIATIDSLNLSLENAEQLAKRSVAPPSVETSTLSKVNRLEHANQTRRHISIQSIASSLRIMLDQAEDSAKKVEKDAQEKETKRTDAEQSIQFDSVVVKKQLETWMNRERVQIVDDITLAYETVDEKEIELELAECQASLDVIQNDKRLHEEHKEKAWWTWFANYKFNNKLIKTYGERGSKVHEQYSETYMDKYKADVELAMAKSIPDQLVQIGKSWGLPDFTIDISPHEPNSFADACRKARELLISTEQIVEQDPSSFDEKKAEEIVNVLEGISQEGQLSEEDHARIAMTAMMALDTDVADHVETEVQALESDASVQALESDASVQALESDASVQALSPSTNVVKPTIPYQDRIGEIGTIIDEHDDSTFQQDAYELLTKPIGSRTIINEINGVDLLFNRDETNPYYSSFLTKNSVCARTFMTSFYNSVRIDNHPDFQFIKDFPRTRNWTVHFPTHMLSDEAKRLVVDDRIPDDFDTKMMLYDKWIQPVLRSLTPDERAIFICFHQGMENATPFASTETTSYLISQGGPVPKKELFDQHILTLDENTFSYQFVKLLYKTDIEKQQEDPYYGEPILVSGTVHIDRKNYKNPEDQSFVQYELFDFHNPFLNALTMQQVITMLFTVKKYLDDPFYSNIQRPVINDTSPFKNVNALNQTEYQVKKFLYHKFLLSSLTEFIRKNMKDKQVLSAIHDDTKSITKSFQNITLDYGIISTALNNIQRVLTTRLDIIHRDFEQMIVRAYSLAETNWDVIVFNVYFEKGKEIDTSPENSLFNKQTQYDNNNNILLLERDAAQLRYDEVMMMDTLKQIIEKIETFKSADRYPIFGKLAEWFDKRNISKNYENRQAFHKKLFNESIELFTKDRKYMDSYVSYHELVHLHTILTQKRDIIGDSSKSLNDESPPPSPSPSPPSSPSPSPPSSPKSSSQTQLNMGALLEKLEALPHDPSNADLQPAARAAEDIVVELDELEEEIRRANAEVERADVASNAERNALPSESNSVPSSRNAELIGEPDVLNAESAPHESDSNESNSNIESNFAPPPKLRVKPSSVPPLPLSSHPNVANSKHAKRVATIANLEAKLAANQAARKSKEVNVKIGTVPDLAHHFSRKHPNFIKKQDLNRVLAGVKAQATQATQAKPPVIPPNVNLNQLEREMNGPFSNQRNKKPTLPKSEKPFNQLFQNEMNEQEIIQKEERKRLNEDKKRQKEEREKELKEEMEHFGINGEMKPFRISANDLEADPPAVDPAVEPVVVASNSPPPAAEPAKPKFKSLTQHTEEAGMNPYVPPLPVNTPSLYPSKYENAVEKEHKSYHNQLNKNPVLKRVLARQATIKAVNEAKIQAMRNQKNLFRQRSIQPPPERSTNKITNQPLPLLSRKSSSILPAPRSVPTLEPSTSSKNPSAGMNAFQTRQKKKEKEKDNAIKQIQAKKFDQIKLKASFGLPLTKNEKAILQPKRGGTRKKTKQSRKKIQTRKRTKRSSSSKRNKRSKQ